MTDKCVDGVCELKERYDDVPPICYCFRLFRRDIEQEIKKTGKTTIPEFISAQVRAGNCRCKDVNPKGTCCLGDISKAVKEIKKEFSIDRGKGEGLCRYESPVTLEQILSEANKTGFKTTKLN